MVAWQYMSIARRHTVEAAPDTSTDEGMDTWVYKVIFEISRPDSDEREEIVAWRTGDDTIKANAHELLNKCGCEGWELVSEVVLASKPNPDGVHGWRQHSVSEAIEIVYRLKRPIGVTTEASTRPGSER